MKNELLEYVSSFDMLSKEEVEQIVDNLESRKFEKGTVLLKEGDISHFCYFNVNSGFI